MITIKKREKNLLLIDMIDNYVYTLSICVRPVLLGRGWPGAS